MELNFCKGCMHEENTGDRIEENMVFERMRPVLETLDTIHGTGIIHMNINPINLREDANGNWKLLNPGSDSYVTSGKRKPVLLKPGYAAHEQYLVHGELGPWTDIYGLCAVMYFAITGQKPPDAMERILKDTLKWPSQLGVKLNPRSEAALMKGLSLFPKDRYQTIKALMEDLYGSSDDRPIHKRNGEVQQRYAFFCLKTILNGRYRAEQLLSWDLYTITYRGLDLRSSTEVNIYQYYPEPWVYSTPESGAEVMVYESRRACYEDGLKIFEEIAQQLMRLGGLPGIEVPCDCFKANQTIYAVKTATKASSLEAVIYKQGPMESDRVFHMMRPVIEALEQLHDMGFIHNHITPRHIVLDENGNAKIMGFEHIRHLPGNKENRPDVFSVKNFGGPVTALPPYFTAPENLDGTVPRGPWTDVYGVCAVIYYALTGKEPYPYGEMEASAHENVAAALAKRSLHVSRRRQAALCKGLAKEPKERFETMARLKDTLYKKGLFGSGR